MVGNIRMGLPKRKSVFERKMHRFVFIAQNLIWAFALHSYMPQYRMSLLADSEGPDQTARMRRLIWAFIVRRCLKTRFLMAWFLSYLHFSASLQQSKIPAEINNSAFKMDNTKNITNNKRV